LVIVNCKTNRGGGNLGTEKSGGEKANSGNENRSERDYRNGRNDSAENYGKGKEDLIRKFLSVKSEEASLHLEYVDTLESLVNNLFRLSGLLSQLRLMEMVNEFSKFNTRFDLLFDKYLSK
jgi:hypothetical protein